MACAALEGHYFSSLPDEAIEAFLLRGTPDGSGEHLPAATLQAYGGAIAAVPDADSAFSHRNATPIRRRGRLARPRRG